MQALRKDFRTGASALIYFKAIGQTAEISMPHRPGEMPEALLISRAGEKLVVSEPFVVASASR